MTDSRRIIGIETEYAFVARDRSGGSAARTPILQRIFAAARERLPHLADLSRSGIFLENGARFYIDAGQHPEMCTPECTDPWEVVRYVRAGERILLALAAEAVSTVPDLEECQFLRHNIDYGGTGSTWGFHESYSHQVPPSRLPNQLLPHLASRIVYAGAGGFDPGSLGIVFTLSPRVSHLNRKLSGSSMSDRGIFHTKDEPLARGGYHRLHLLCGNSLGSETALWLTVGTTALIVALVEGGEQPGKPMLLADPVGAMQMFAHDPACSAEAMLTDGRRLTAVQIQRHYLERAEACIGSPFMPGWTEEVCDSWREILDHLETGRGELWRRLDWTIKLAIYDDQLRRCGMDWPRVAFWTDFVVRHGRKLELPESFQIFGLLDIFGGAIQLDVLIRSFQPHLRRERLDGDELRRFLRLRQEFFEIDTRFSRLGEDGIFNSIDAAGELRHRVVDPGSIERAMTEPPQGTRARVRGEFIRRVWGKQGEYFASWEMICEKSRRRGMDLNDPFESEEKWKPSLRPGRSFRRPPPSTSIDPDEEDRLSEADRIFLESLGI